MLEWRRVSHRRDRATILIGVFSISIRGFCPFLALGRRMQMQLRLQIATETLLLKSNSQQRERAGREEKEKERNRIDYSFLLKRFSSSENNGPSNNQV